MFSHEEAVERKKEVEQINRETREKSEIETLEGVDRTCLQ